MTEPTTTKTSYLASVETRISRDLAAVIEGKVPVDTFIDAVMLQIKTSFKNGIRSGRAQTGDD